MKTILLTLVFACSAAFAGSEANLFVPNQYAPLSSFQEKTTSTPETLTFEVSPALIQYVISNNYPGWVAFADSITGAVTLLPPTSYDATQGKVRLLTQSAGKYVVVAEPFTNDYPIVTHWKQSLNSGMGGFELGAADAIGTLEYCLKAGDAIGPLATCRELDVGTVVENTDLFDPDPASPFTYNTRKYALFSSDPVSPNARVPGFERYVGENYSIDRITDRLATYMSLRALEETGFPLLHRNHPWAFYDPAPAAKKVTPNIPAFQVVHSMVLAPEADKPSLATFILPPYWTNAPAAPYPVIFNGFYDINQNFIWVNGLDFIKVIGNLKNKDGKSAIGILWNGGGALVSQSMQMSSYLNVAYLFYVSGAILGADLQKVVTVGISRGGGTALHVAANPYFNNYHVGYALAYSPPVALGEHATQWFSTNYPGDFTSVSWATGYKYSQLGLFIDPITGLDGPHVFLNNIAGSADPNAVDQMSPGSDWIINALKAKGTSVFLSAGTNDGSIPFDHEVRLYNRMVNAGIPVEFDIGYRFGHNFFTDKNAQIYWAMKEIISGTNTPLSGMKHFRRVAETGAGFNQAEQFTPVNSLAVAVPKMVFPGERVKVEAAGSPGLTYAIAYYKIDDALWTGSHQILVTSAAQYIQIGTFPTNGEVLSQAIDFNIPTNIVAGNYVYVAAVRTGDGGTWTLLDLSKVPQPVPLDVDRISVFEVKATEPVFPAIDLSNQYYIQGRGWGLSVF